jgi:hypothetical protein
MYHSKSQCIVEGCNGKTRGKDYCGKHLKEHQLSKVITTEARRSMVSECCKAGCVAGKRHEYGEQYCSKCQEACQWKTLVREKVA